MSKVFAQFTHPTFFTSLFIHHPLSPSPAPPSDAMQLEHQSFRSRTASQQVASTTRIALGVVGCVTEVVCGYFVVTLNSGGRTHTFARKDEMGMK